VVSRRIGVLLALGGLWLASGCAATGVESTVTFVDASPEVTITVDDGGLFSRHVKGGETFTTHAKDCKWELGIMSGWFLCQGPGTKVYLHPERQAARPSAPAVPPAKAPSPPAPADDARWAGVFTADDVAAPPADFSGKWLGPSGADLAIEQAGADVTVTLSGDPTPRNQWKGKVTGRVVRGATCLNAKPIAIRIAPDRSSLTVAVAFGAGARAHPFVPFVASEARARRYGQTLKDWSEVHGDADLSGPPADLSGTWLQRPGGWPKATIVQEGEDVTVTWTYGAAWKGKVSGRVFLGALASGGPVGAAVRFRLEPDGRSVVGGLLDPSGQIFSFEMDHPSGTPARPGNALPAAPPPAPVAPAAPAPRPPQTGGTFVLVVGINEYKDAKIPKLRFAEADAQAVYSFFATEDRSPTAGDRVTVLLGADATRLAILKAIREQLVLKARRPEDTAILYFSGHGFANAKETFLAGADTELALLGDTGLSGASLRDLWAEIPAGHKVILLDACHAGGIEGLRGIGGVALAPGAGAAAGAPGSTSVTIAASGPNEFSVEDKKLGHGVFTTALLNGLRGAADTDGDGRVSARELGRFLVQHVPELAARADGQQTPVVEESPGAEGLFLTR
jgi:hypothetical protein